MNGNSSLWRLSWREQLEFGGQNISKHIMLPSWKVRWLGTLFLQTTSSAFNFSSRNWFKAVCPSKSTLEDSIAWLLDMNFHGMRMWWFRCTGKGWIQDLLWFSCLSTLYYGGCGSSGLQMEEDLKKNIPVKATSESVTWSEKTFIDGNRSKFTEKPQGNSFVPNKSSRPSALSSTSQASSTSKTRCFTCHGFGHLSTCIIKEPEYSRFWGEATMHGYGLGAKQEAKINSSMIG